ncbi:MAG TPA: 30S ribosomal protein S12 methylthiotransferase RimO [Firmicutes bacterium]|nr:30S ribosomal protein S12 methylthiotransferase RimO [Bacillota bacterium]
MKVGLISLGCAKNQIDSEEVLSYLARNEFIIVGDLSLAEMIIINTCGFLKASKKEAYDVIDEVKEYNVPIVVIGCLAERNEEELKKDKPFVDLVIPIHDYPNFGYKLQKLIKDKKLSGNVENTKRVYSTPSYQAYLKISDGCNNRCTYCTIPLIRGGFHSIPLKTLQIQMDEIASNGVKELVVISQDTTRYGTDHPELKEDICTLLKEALKHEEFKFIRLLYLYPDEITDSLIDLFKDNPRLTPYFDVPIQHSSDKILSRMHRRGDRKYLSSLFKKIREKIPNAILRTTIMVGFPSENEEDIADLLSFMNEVKFDHLGVFTYSREKGTPSYDYDEQVPSKVKAERYNRVMKEQAKISYEQNKKHLGEVMTALITGYDEENLCYRGTSYVFAPDDIDGELSIYSDRELEIGSCVKVKIVNTSIYDLIGELIH